MPTAAAERGWGDTVGAWAAFFVLRGLGLGMGGGLQNWIGEEGVDRPDVVFCVACRGGRAGSAGRLDLHWSSSGIDHDTDIDGG
jgi:hypothetical protein